MGCGCTKKKSNTTKTQVVKKIERPQQPQPQQKNRGYQGQS
jgi:hypothetical protein